MVIKTHVSFKEYVKLLFGLSYRRPVMKVIVVFDLLMMLWIAFYYVHVFTLPKPAYYQYGTVALITVVQPVVIYLTVKRNYDSSNHLREQLEIAFTEEEIKIQGESFFMALTWEKTFKVDELQHYFLIYQNNLSAVIVPKKAFSKNALTTFRNMLLSLPVPKLHLQKD